MSDEQSLSPTVPRGRTPVPDPTELTDRAIARLREEMRLYIDGQFEVRDERFRGIDAANSLRLVQVTVTHDAIRADIDQVFRSLKELVETKFDAIERLRIEQKRDTKDAVDSAFRSAKEAVLEQTTASDKAIAKAEVSTGKELESLRRELGVQRDREVDDVRALRVEITSVASIANGSIQQRTGAKEDRSTLYAGIGAVTAVIVVGIALLGIVLSRPV